ncbi:MAG: B12-binding domain-containing radical SAM protein [Candidatus Hermodarchaeota archaeon]
MEKLSQKKEKFRIIYLFPQEVGDFKGHNAIYTYFLRISNYLNSRKEELSGEIEEIYVDLRLEELPPFSFKDLAPYLEEAKVFLLKLYKAFPFSIIAISCYSSYEYLNSVIIACLIKSYINPYIKIIVGGYHPTIIPEDFQSDKFPSFIYETFPKIKKIFEYLITGEGEIAFFELIKHLMNIESTERTNRKEDLEIIQGKMFPSLDELPIIDLSLLKRYKDKLKGRRLNIDFGRNCMFHCKICPPATGRELPYHKRVRFKSIDKCIEELRIIRDTKWLETKAIMISDPVFFPKRRLRNEFYEKFRKFINEEGGFPYTISIYDRVNICTKEDLLHYKKFNIQPHLGFESASIPMLKNINKISSKNDRHFETYIRKVENLIRYSNEINLIIWVNLIIGLPSETKEVIKDNQRFFLEKRFNGKGLSERYKIILSILHYKALPGSIIYNDCEKKFGGKIYYKNWWRKPLANHRVYNKIVRPSKNLDFLTSLRLNYEWLKEFVQHQIKNKTPFYDKGDFKILREGYFKISYMYKNRDVDYYSFIPESWKQHIIFP